jgi:1,4-dihydroxy-2-naphthoate octaprenyltransferase
MNRETLKAILEVLKKNKTMVLTTQGDNLWSSRIYFASKGLFLYAIIERSKNFQNIEKNKRVFFVIDSGTPDHFIQGEGVVEILGPPQEREKERALLFQKIIELIPFVKKIPNLVVIKIRPTKIFLSDFRTVFKPREEISIGEGDLDEALQMDKGISKLGAYFKATRPFAFTATLISVLLGAFLAPHLNIFLLLLTFLGVLFIHAGVNALNDLMDYRYGVDDWLVLGASRVLQDNLLSQREQLFLIVILLSLGTVVGLILSLLKGYWVLIIGFIGGLLGVFYQVKPIGLKYRALGDFSVFLAFGPLLALGSYYVQTGSISMIPLIVAIPVGLLVIGILHGNNFRDLVEDVRGGYQTMASLLGVKGSSFYYAFLISLAYFLIFLFVVLKILPWQALLTLLTLPIAYRNIKLAQRPDFLQFGLLDLFTAKLHLSFGLLLILGILFSKITYGG